MAFDGKIAVFRSVLLADQVDSRCAHNCTCYCGDWIFELDIGLASNLHVLGNWTLCVGASFFSFGHCLCLGCGLFCVVTFRWR